MRRHIGNILILTVGLLYATCEAAESGEVLVTKLENGVPTVQTSTNDFYRNKLVRGLEKRTPDVKSEKPKEWRKLYELCSAALIRGAKQSGWQSDSLEKLLRGLPAAEENKALAVVPVAIHQTQHEGEPVWIITLKWEGEDIVKKSGSPMAHIRHFWFSRKSLKQTGFLTCA